MEMPLTDRQKEVMKSVAKFIHANNYPPTINEIQENTGLNNPGSVYSALTSLEDKGYITRKKHKNRNIRLTDIGKKYLPNHKEKEPLADTGEKINWGLPKVQGGFKTIVADPPWKFQNKTGKVAPEHDRLFRYETLTMDEIKNMPIEEMAAEKSHCYLWTPNALLPETIKVLDAWGFEYKTNLIWFKSRKDGGPDRRGVGFYYRNVTEMLLMGVKGGMRTLQPGRSMPNMCKERKKSHSVKPDSMYHIIEQCSPAPRIDLFAREKRPGWYVWGNEVEIGKVPEDPEREIPGVEDEVWNNVKREQKTPLFDG